MRELDFYTTAYESTWLLYYAFSVLKRLDPVELQLKINRFKMLDFMVLSPKQIEDELNHVFDIEINPKSKIRGLNYLYKQLKEGNWFFRVRKFKDMETLVMELDSENSCWNPPPKYVRTYGRLNKPQESLLYTAREPSTALREMKMKEGELFVLLSYKNVQPITVWYIAPEYNHILRFVKDQQIIQIHNILLSFLVDLFTMDVNEGQEYLYKITEIISKLWYVTTDIYQGWMYPSVKNRTQFNVCFDPECFKKSGGMKRSLSLLGGIVCRSAGDVYYTVENIITKFDEKGHPIIDSFGGDYSTLYKLGLKAYMR